MKVQDALGHDTCVSTVLSPKASSTPPVLQTSKQNPQIFWKKRPTRLGRGANNGSFHPYYPLIFTWIHSYQDAGRPVSVRQLLLEIGIGFASNGNEKGRDLGDPDSADSVSQAAE